MAQDVREVEWQFDALDLRPVVRWLGSPAAWLDGSGVRVAAVGTSSQADLYLDTDDQRFHRAGYALRIRRVGRRREAEATLKGLNTASQAAPGLRSRRELSERLASADPALLASAPGPVGERLRAVAGRKRLLPLFEVRTRRRTFTVETDGAAPGEIALDETAIRPADGGPPARFRRVEIELAERSLPALGSFVEELRSACGLQPAALSKYEAGLLSADIRAPTPERFGSTEIDPDATIGTVALAVLRRQFSVLLAKEPGTRLGDDIEELHDMRVASRRLRAALSLFREVLPAGTLELRDELGWVGQQLGAVRDLDVQLEQLEGWRAEVPEEDRDALAALRGLLEEQRAEARATMLEALDSRRYEAFVSRFGRTLRARHSRGSGPPSLPALAVAPDLIEGRWAAFRKDGKRIGPGSPAAEYHRLRIRCKRLRYALEFLNDLYPGKARPVIKRLTSLQDLLGLHQDADVAIERLRRLAGERGGKLQPETVFAMGEIAERHRQSMADLRAQFPRAYARLGGQRWKSFRELIEEQRPSSPPPAPPQAPPPPPEAVPETGPAGTE
jgi:triphosphatase